AATDSNGKITVAWVGGREKNFHIYVASQAEGGKFREAKRLTQLEGNEWEPAVAASADGKLAVGFDTYSKGDYEGYVAPRKSAGRFEAAQPVAASLLFEVRPSLAYDGKGRLWIAYELSGDEWGKDWGALKKKGVPLYQMGRMLDVKVMDGEGKWFEPEQNV